MYINELILTSFLYLVIIAQREKNASFPLGDANLQYNGYKEQGILVIRWVRIIKYYVTIKMATILMPEP